MTIPCPACHCSSSNGSATHAVVAAVIVDDIDAAIFAGLLEVRACLHCDATCTTHLLAARDARLAALAARARFKARNARLQRHAEQRAARRVVPRALDDAGSEPKPPPLPAAAAAALARAKARAAAKP